MAAPNLVNIVGATPVTFDLALTNSAADVIAAVTGSHAYLIFEMLAAYHLPLDEDCIPRAGWAGGIL